jgi:hypothetical protein
MPKTARTNAMWSANVCKHDCVTSIASENRINLHRGMVNESIQSELLLPKHVVQQITAQIFHPTAASLCSRCRHVIVLRRIVYSLFLSGMHVYTNSQLVIQVEKQRNFFNFFHVSRVQI